MRSHLWLYYALALEKVPKEPTTYVLICFLAPFLPPGHKLLVSSH